VPSVTREHTQTEVGWLRGVKHDIGMTNVQYCHRNTVYVLYICRECAHGLTARLCPLPVRHATCLQCVSCRECARLSSDRGPGHGCESAPACCLWVVRPTAIPVRYAIRMQGVSYREQVLSHSAVLKSVRPAGRQSFQLISDCIRI
jgi:hypothetical protein